MQRSFASIGENPNPKIWESPRKRKRAERNKKPTITEKSLQYFKVFKVDDEKLLCKCLLCDEKTKPINGTKSFNLSSHLKSIYPTTYAKLVDNEIKEPLPVKRLRILQNAVEIVSVNGRPFSWLTDSGYIAGIEKKLEKLKNAGIGINISHENVPEVREHLKTMAEKVRNQIREEINERFLCVMVDHRKSIMGVSVQFIKNSKIVIRSLGMLEMKQSHTSQYLTEVLNKCLTELGIEK